MKRVLFGALAGAAVTYVLCKMSHEGKFDKFYEEVDDFAGTAKEKAEYYADRTGRKARVVKRNLEHKVDDLKDVINDKLHNLQPKES